MSSPAPASYAFDQFAEAYQAKFMHLALYNDTYDAFCELIPQPQARIFEIGCGPGNITHYLLQARPDFQLTAIDIAPNMLRLATLNNPQASFRQLDARSIGHLTESYEGIMCGFCLPYLNPDECQQLFADSAKLLVEGGILYLSTIEGEREHAEAQASSDGSLQLVTYYYSEDFLTRHLAAAGLTTVSVTRKSYPAGGSHSTHLVILARKN